MEIKVKTAHRENFSSGRSVPVKYIVVHYTGNLGDTAGNNAAYFAREVVGASAHFFVDEIEVWRSVPENCTAWHCGTKGRYYHPDCRNRSSIGVEICMLDKLGHIRQGSIDCAAELVRELMRKYGIPAERVMRHYDVTHKSCPEPMVLHPELWQAFKTKIQEDDDMTQDKFNQMFKTAMEDYRKELQTNDAGEWSAEAREILTNMGVFAGNVKTTDGEPNYMWGDFLTREQAAVLLLRFGRYTK